MTTPAFNELVYSNLGDKKKKEHLEDILKTQTLVKFDPQCVRTKSNIGKIVKQFKFDHEAFLPNELLEKMPYVSPKLEELLDNIETLDKTDMKRENKQYKHFIFSDLTNSNAGVKLIASAMIARGYNLGYTADLIDPPTKTETPKSPLHKPASRKPPSTRRMKSISDEREYEMKSPDIDYSSEESDDDDDDRIPKKSPYEKIKLKSEEELKKTDNNFFLLSSKSVYSQKITTDLKKSILTIFNKRPENAHGNLARFIIMDSGYKEGIDLFDVKYIHIFEPSLVESDRKQVVGRGTRTCGQKGLEFHPTMGWPLHVYIYDLKINEELRDTFMDSVSAIHLYMKSVNIDYRLYTFSSTLERISIFGSVDYELNKNIHSFSIHPEYDVKFDESEFRYNRQKSSPLIKQIANTPTENQTVSQEIIQYAYNTAPPMGFDEMRHHIRDNYLQYAWDKVKMENLCEEKTDVNKQENNLISFTPTQNFISHFFTPESPIKGMLLHHSVGTGKTCTAIATATSGFETQGYTILWVTRTTLKNDIWKNMFDMVCNSQIRDKIINSGLQVPKDMKSRMALVSKSWRIRPMSYKQFSNLILKRNSFYEKLTNINGTEDPLHKTLVIIDEAHKLYGGDDLSAIERPDMGEFHKAIMNSYTKSGKDSVRLLLMTATPITNDPMELIKLINLCKQPAEQLPDDFDAFSSMYLDSDGTFSNKGSATFLDQIAGHISYLNREKDARQFAQPLLHKIDVPIVKDTNLLRYYDNKYVKKYMDSEIIPMKQEIEDKLKYIEKFSNVDKRTFTDFKGMCGDYDDPKYRTACKRIVNKNLNELISEFKGDASEVKEQLKTLKEEFKNKNLFKGEMLKNVRDNIVNNRDEYINYKTTPYNNMANKCQKKVKTMELTDIISQVPEIQQYDGMISAETYKINMQRQFNKELTNNHRDKMRTLKKLNKETMKSADRKVMDLIIKEEQKVYKKLLEDNNFQLSNLKDNLKVVKAKRRILAKKLTQKSKKMLSEEIKLEKSIARAEKRTRKALRKQDDYVEELTEKNLIELNEKYKQLAKEQIQERIQEIENKKKKTRKNNRAKTI